MSSLFSCETNIDDCKAFDNPCKHNGQCMDGNNTYTCQCIPSWSGINCTIEQDPCLPKPTPCSNNASCQRDADIGI